MEDINELVKYDVTDAAIAGYREELLPLTINGIEDKDGYYKVNEARLFIKGERVSVEHRRKELKESSLEFGRKVDAEAKRITAGLSEIEEHLEAEKQKVDDEVARIKFESEQRAKLPERIKKLTELGEVVSDEEYGRYEAELLKLDDAGFDALVNRLTAEKLERQAKEQRETEARLAAEREKLEAEKRTVEEQAREAEREKQHQAELETARKEAAERAKFEAERDAQKRAQEQFDAERQAKVEAERIEAERPDTEKLKAFADTLAALNYPEVTSRKALTRLNLAKAAILDIIEALNKN